MSLLPAVMSLNEAAYVAGFDATAYSSGLTKPTPCAVAGCAAHVGEALTSASIAAQIGVDDDVPPTVRPAAEGRSKTVIAPVNSSACAETSGTSRHGVEGRAGHVRWQKSGG